MNSKKAKGAKPASARTPAPSKGKAKRGGAAGELTEKDIIDMAQAKTLAWRKDLLKSPTATRTMLELSGDELIARVTELLKIGDVTLDLQLAAVLDYFVAAVVFGQSQQFSEQTMSAFFTLAHQLLENLRDKKMTLEENMAFFKATMEQHASLHSDCDDDGKLFDFDPKCTALVSQYFRRGIFQHYKLFERLFFVPRPCEDTPVPCAFELPAKPFALDEAVPLADYDAYLNPNPPPPAASASAGDEASAGDAAAAAAADEALGTLTPEEVKRITDATMQRFVDRVEQEVRAKIKAQSAAVSERMGSAQGRRQPSGKGSRNVATPDKRRRPGSKK